MQIKSANTLSPYFLLFSLPLSFVIAFTVLTR